MKRSLAVALLLAACSDVHHGVDAGPRDATSDTLVPSMGDPTPTAVRLVVTRGGKPVPNVAVFFQAADSSLVTAQLTNELGLAWAEVGSGGFVTALEDTGAGSAELSTFASVEPADALQLDFSPTGPTDEWPVMISVPSEASVTAFRIYTSCGGPFGLLNGGTAEATLVGCNGIADAVVVGEDDSSQPITAFYANDLVVPPAPEPLGFAALPINGTYAALVTKSFAYSNVPAEVSFVGTYHAFASAHGRVYERTAGDTVSGGAVTTQLALPTTNAMSLVVSTMFSSDVGSQSIYEVSGAAPYALDVGAAQLPPFASQPSYDPATHEVAWTERSGPVAPDLVRARIHAYREGRAWGWRLVAPRAATSVKYPVLPSFGFDFNPHTGDTLGVSELTTADVPGGYAAARHIGFTDFTRLLGATPDRMIVESLTVMPL